MIKSAAVDAAVFATLVFGFTAGVLPVLGDRPFSWESLLFQIGLGAVLWFAAAMLFSRPTTWHIPQEDYKWLEQQIEYLRLQPAKLRKLGPGGHAYKAPMSFHFRSELWLRPAATVGHIRIDGPVFLLWKLRRRYDKHAASQV
jgi:hypothetical protein